MIKSTKKALKFASIFAAIFFLIPFITNWMEVSFMEGLLNGIVGGFILGGIAFLISKSLIINKVTFKWWQWIFYVLGLVFGLTNILFWLYVILTHKYKNHGDNFFNENFHIRVYIWGTIFTILYLILIIIILLI